MEVMCEVGVLGLLGSFWMLMVVVVIWIIYFVVLYLNFCDFLCYCKSECDLWIGNVWGLLVNLLVFCFVVGVIIIVVFYVYGEVLLYFDVISVKFDSWFLVLLVVVIFVVVMLGINVVVNFVLVVFDFLNIMFKYISFKCGGFIVVMIVLILYLWVFWEINVMYFVNFIGLIMGLIFGIIMVDYYLICKGVVNVVVFYDEYGEFCF